MHWKELNEEYGKATAQLNQCKGSKSIEISNGFYHLITSSLPELKGTERQMDFAPRYREAFLRGCWSFMPFKSGFDESLEEILWDWVVDQSDAGLWMGLGSANNKEDGFSAILTALKKRPEAEKRPLREVLRKLRAGK